MGSTTNEEHYDLVTIGSGEAAKYIAWTHASSAGKKCAVIEHKWLGGSCPNVACLPSKNMIHSAKVLSSHSERLQQSHKNKTVAIAEKTDMRAVKKIKDDMIDGLMTLHNVNFEKNKADLIWGHGKFVGPKKIEVTNTTGSKRMLEADAVVLRTGSRANISEVPGLEEANPLTHVEMLNIEEVPDHLVIVGGGYIGLEFAQAMRRFGSKVTVLEHNTRILKREDDDVATLVQEILEKERVVFNTNTNLSLVSGKSGEKVVLSGRVGDEPFEIEGSHILCATGRLPNTEDLGLDQAGVKLTSNGHIEVDEWNRTAAADVYAVGDCAGSPYFTHIGFDDFRIVRDCLSGKVDSSISRKSSRQVPFTLFTDPEVAHVGLRVHEARTRGVQYRLAKIPMAAILKTRTLGQTEGFAKVLVAQDSDVILGFTAVGPGAGELLPVVQLAMKRNLAYSDIAELVITHPTLSEGLVALFGSVPLRS